MRVTDKASILLQYMKDNKLKKEQILFMGDDIPDLKVMQVAGLACCPIDAVAEIKSISQYISHLKGGEACARDVIEKVMKLQGNWNEDVTVRAQ